MKNGSALRSPMNDLHKDLRAVARDTESLLKVTAEMTGDRVHEVRSRAQESLRNTYDHLYDRRMRRRVRRMAHDADSYVRDHTWSVVGVAAGVALLVGLLMRRD